MKTIIITVLLLIISVEKINAQIFIDKASIEFEVVSNIKKNMGNDSWAERMGDKLPVFKKEYYDFTFADNKSIYVFNRLDEKDKFPEWMRSENKNKWFTDFTTSKINVEKEMIGSMFNVEDSLPKMEWRLINENRNIAGFNCKKAVSKIFDSVYVFAFYTNEIMISGGPCSVSGLPGMILGLTIPRLFTSYIATKVNVNGVDATAIKAPVAKKVYTQKTLKTLVDERTKDWWNGDGGDEQVQQRNRFVWGMLL
jgi:GLPGLI family protein